MNEELTPDLASVDALLRRSSQAFVYPHTPAVAPSVLRRLQEPSPSLGERVGAWLARPAVRYAAAALGALTIVLGASLAVPQSRTALADLFGLSNVRVETPAPDVDAPVLSPESFARPASLDEASAAVDFELRFPPSEPQALYVSDDGPAVITVYEDYDLYQSRDASFLKGVAADSFREIDFDGMEALWIDQGGHIAAFEDEQGRLVVESQRTVERATLFWEEDGVTYRLETSLSQEEALDIARSQR